MMNLSIRARATLYLSGLVSLLLLSFAIILGMAVSSSLERDFHLRMQRDADLLTELFKEELRLKALDEFREEAAELGLNLRVMDPEGRVLFQSRGWGQTISDSQIHPPPAELSEIWVSVVANGMPHTIISRRVHTEPHPIFVLQFAQSKAPIVETQRMLLRWSLGIIPFMLILSVAIGYFFAGKLLAPIHHLRRQTEALRPHDLSARLPYPSTRDELYFLTETLNGALRRIEDAFATLKAFAADASHELRMPLTAMRGVLELALRRERTPEEYRSALREALEEAEQLSRITSDLLALTRAEAGEHTLRRTSVPLNTFLEACVDHFQKTHTEAQVQLAGIPDITVPMDADQINRVFLNLMENAFKYAGAHKPVEIRAHHDGYFVYVLIADQGPGIAAADQERVFDRFYRADKSEPRERSGSGLGLAIASAIVRSHGGGLRIKETSSKGTVFEVSLPLENSNPSLKRA